MPTLFLLAALGGVAQPPEGDAPPGVATVVIPAAPAAAATPAEAKPAEDRWPLMTFLQGTAYGVALDDNRLKLYGWSESSFTGSTARRSNLPLGFDYEADRYLLQQNYLRFERTTTADTPETTYGFRTDFILPGADYRFTVARGLLDRQLTDNKGGPIRYGIDPVQFYALANVPTVGAGLELRAGRFFSQYGVESIDTTLNDLASHSYSFIYNPFTHTGGLATLKIDDAWTVQAGLTTGSDVFLDGAANATAIGSAKWAPPNGATQAVFAFIVGRGRFDQPRQFHNPEIFDLVVTHAFDERTQYTFEALYGFTTNVPGSGFANWYGVVNYLKYQVTDTTASTTRLEFFDDSQGQRTGFAGLYTALTTGVEYTPKPWLRLRPELRYDRNDARPFEGRANLFTALFDVTVRW